MSEKRYVVPEGMRLAAGRATNGVDPEGFLIYPALEAALRWQSENLKVPTEKEWAACLQDARRDSGISPVMAWVRRMYLTPEPEVPEEIKDLLLTRGCHKDIEPFKDELNLRMAECFRRGQKTRTA